jgi:aspartokinase
MVTVPQLISSIIKNSPILSENFEEGLINYSSLARKLQPEIETKLYKKVTIGSIVMALKRLKIAKSGRGQLSLALSKITDLSLRSNLIALTFNNSASLFNNQSQLLDIAAKTPNSFLTISTGIHETSIFISSHLLNEAQLIFQHESLKLKVEGISSITLILPEDAVDTPGIHYSVFKKLFSNGVNVFDTATTFTELTIFLRSEDIEKAFAVLKDLN